MTWGDETTHSFPYQSSADTHGEQQNKSLPVAALPGEVCSFAASSARRGISQQPPPSLLAAHLDALWQSGRFCLSRHVVTLSPRKCYFLGPLVPEVVQKWRLHLVPMAHKAVWRCQAEGWTLSDSLRSFISLFSFAFHDPKGSWTHYVPEVDLELLILLLLPLQVLSPHYPLPFSSEKGKPPFGITIPCDIESEQDKESFRPSLHIKGRIYVTSKMVWDHWNYT